jgi:hypothetical protein
MRVGEFKFKNGLLQVESEEDAEKIRRADDYYTGHIVELESAADAEAPRESTVARQGMKGTALNDKQAEEPGEVPEPPQAPPQERPQAPWPQDAEPVDPSEVFDEDDATDTDVIIKPGGWYEYGGKSYRKADLPPDVKKLV